MSVNRSRRERRPKPSDAKRAPLVRSALPAFQRTLGVELFAPDATLLHACILPVGAPSDKLSNMVGR